MFPMFRLLLDLSTLLIALSNQSQIGRTSSFNYCFSDAGIRGLKVEVASLVAKPEDRGLVQARDLQEL